MKKFKNQRPSLPLNKVPLPVVDYYDDDKKNINPFSIYLPEKYVGIMDAIREEIFVRTGVSCSRSNLMFSLILVALDTALVRFFMTKWLIVKYKGIKFSEIPRNIFSQLDKKD